MHLSETDDFENHRRLHDLFRVAFLTSYRANNPKHELYPSVVEEIQTFRQRVEAQPVLALGVALAKYHFMWYREADAEMDVESVEDAANLMYMSIQFSECNNPAMPIEMFLQRMCNARWPFTVMLLSELGREYAMRYLTDQAANILEGAVAAFDEMKRLPYYAGLTHWHGPYDINFNEELFTGVQPGNPLWDAASLPIAQLLQGHAQEIAQELGAMVEQGLLDKLHFEEIRAEGRDSAPEGARMAVEFMKIDPEAPDRWGTAACRAAPGTCGLLSSRPEMGCPAASATLVRLRAGGKLKPHFGRASTLRCDLPLQADLGAGFSIGNQSKTWSTGQAIAYDETYINQEWHAGVKGEHYMLQISFCHPCLDAQRQLYGPQLFCPGGGSAPQAAAAAAGAASVAFPDSRSAAGGGQDFVLAPFAEAAVWAVTLPELAKCNQGIGTSCPPDTQHGGANPLSALNTWNYALNNLKAALRYSGVNVDPAVATAIAQVQAGIQGFLAQPALELFAPILEGAMQVFEAVFPWLQEQPPARVPIKASQNTVKVPSDGTTPLSSIVFPLGNGMQMPAVGFGTWKLEGTSCYDAVKWAIGLGVRHIDTAEAYGNEADVGRALRDSGVPRGELFLTTKATRVPLGMAEPSYTETIFVQQLQDLQVDYVDVYMLHAAGERGERLKVVWREMERMHDMGRARSLGVSNFGIDELEELWAFARVRPAYVQNIYKVYKPGEQIVSGSTVSLREWTASRGVAMVGYSVINSWPHMLPPLEDPHIVKIAKAHSRTTSQVLHRWALQHGIAVIPKASSLARIRENIGLFDFELSPADMAALDGLATLSESTHDELRPSWAEDVYGMRT